MDIAVAHVTDMFGRKIGSVLFNTESCSFRDTSEIIDQPLPVQSHMGLEINNNNTAVIVGKSRDKYAVCFGDNYIYLLSVGSLSRYTVINTNIADIPDLSGMFGEPSVEFLNHLANKQSTSLGVTRKFFGKSKYGYCILKFSKYPDTCVYLDNEVFCYKIALILGVSCCRAFRTKYSGRDCVLV